MQKISRRGLLVGAGGVATAATVAGIVRADPAEATAVDMSGKITDTGGQYFNVKHSYISGQPGAAGDGVITTGTISSLAGSNAKALTVASSTGAAIGMVITVQGAAGGATLSTTIDGVAGTTITLHDAATSLVTNVTVAFGTDDTQAITNAIHAARNIPNANTGPSGTVFIPPGVYMITAALEATEGTSSVVGAGGRYVRGQVPDAQGSATILMCAKPAAGFVMNSWGSHRGFLVHGNRIATNPITQGVISIGLDAGCYGTASDVWSTQGAAPVGATRPAGWRIYGTQNYSYYDCGTTDNDGDGLYLDGGAGGNDFWRFTEAGSKGIGIKSDALITTGLGGFANFTGDNRFIGGSCTTSSSDPQGGAKINLAHAENWKFYGVTILGDNNNASTITLGGNNSYAIDLTGSTVSASSGYACIEVTAAPNFTNPYMFLWTDRMRFLRGDFSVQVDASGPARFSAIGWICDNTLHGPATRGVSPDPVAVTEDTPLLGRSEAWRTVLTFGTGWVAPVATNGYADGIIQYRTRADGVIELRGYAKSKTAGSGSGGTLFTFPADYQPNGGSGPNLLFPAPSSSTTTPIQKVQLTSPGVLSCATTAAGTIVYFDGISFPTE